MRDVQAGTPALDVRVDLTRPRVLIDSVEQSENTRLRWFETTPGQFHYGYSFEDAVELRSFIRRFTGDTGVTYRQIDDEFGPVFEVTDDYDRSEFVDESGPVFD